MTRNQFVAFVESGLDHYRDAGYEFVGIFKHVNYDDMFFVEAYKNYEQSRAARKYWMAQDYVVTKFHDLGYLDYIRERNASAV